MESNIYLTIAISSSILVFTFLIEATTIIQKAE